MKKILIMGLPGSGKTTLANEVYNELISRGKTVSMFNADNVRECYQDWDFSEAGRLRQVNRMKNLCDFCCSVDYTIADFVCPTENLRKIFDANFTVWVNTIDLGRFEDTNKVFETPSFYDVRVTTMNSELWAKNIVDILGLKLS